MSKSALIILGKFPKKGNVKTRLAQTLGEEKAVEIYKQCAEKVFFEIQQLRNEIPPFFYYGNVEDKSAIKEWIGDKFSCIDPKSNDIEKHLLNAFTEKFEDGAKKVVSIATDVPGLTAEIIREAFKNLENHDVVLGPDHNGGFYLFGIKKFYPGLFEYKYKNPENMFNEEIERIKSFGLSYHILPELIDIDTHEDLKSSKMQ